MTMIQVPLHKIAYARSGDKGNSANVGVIAYTPVGYAFLFRILTEERVVEFFAPIGLKQAVRYALPNLEAFNFVLQGILGGGASRSLRIDSQGKVLGQALLEMIVEVPEELLSQMLPSK